MCNRVSNLRQHNAAIARELSTAEIAIFPTRNKVPLIKGWRTSASFEPDQVEQWWRLYPDAAPGIELSMSNLIVLDCDRHPGAPDGVAAFERLIAGRVMPPHPITATPGGGFHHIFAMPDVKPLGCSRGRIPAGIDVKGCGGFLIAPGSMRLDGGVYRPVEGTPGLCEAFRREQLAKLPRWLHDMLKPPPVRRLTTYQPRDDDEQRVVDALRRIPADDREVWLRVGMALKAHFGEAGRKMWDWWSARCEKKFSALEQESAWRSFDGSGITIATLFYYAAGGHA